MQQTLSSSGLYLRLLSHVRPYRFMFGGAIFAMIVLALTEPAVAALMKPLLDGTFVEKDPTAIRTMPFLLVGLFLVRGLSSFASTTLMTWVASRVVMDLRREMFEKLLVLPIGYYDANVPGILMSKLLYDVRQVTKAATDALIVLVRDSLIVIGLLAWMLYLNWRLSLILLLIVPVIGALVKLISRRLRGLNQAQQRNIGELTRILQETIGGQKVVRLFGGESYERARFHHANNWARRYTMKIAMVAAANAPVVQFIAVIAMAISIYVAAQQSGADEITVGGFVSYFGSMALLMSPLKRLTRVNEHIQKGLAASESVFFMLDSQSEPDTGTRHLGRAQGRLEFQNVSQLYASMKSPALNSISLTLKQGETIALVGPSGSGKTSLVNLISRFYTPTKGKILLDDIDIRQLQLADLRANIALVSQDVVLFNDTVGANIAYGSMNDCPQDQIIAAAEAAHAMEFIEKMPQGMDTMIGENGVRLSGGQRQRLAIARALLKDAPVLILDEATSALDNQSEKHVQAALEAVKRGRTTIIIAHRLSTIVGANRIVVISEGSVAEVGNHSELLAQDGIYASLYLSQIAKAPSP